MTAPLDRDLAHLPPDQRWHEWLRRLEAVLFASASPVGRDALARVVGQDVSVDLLIDDLAAELAARPYDVVRMATGWMLRTRPAYGAVIRVAADIQDQSLDLRDTEMTVLAAIAYHQPVTRDGLKQIFGREISRELIGRLVARGLIGAGPRAPRSGAPHTYVTTQAFLVAFDLPTLADLPELDGLEDAGLAQDHSGGLSSQT